MGAKGKGKAKAKYLAGSVTKSCNASTWTEFYDAGLTGENEFIWVQIISDDGGLIKIDIDDNEVFSGKLSDLMSVFIGNDYGSYNEFYVDSYMIGIDTDYALKISLAGWIGQNLKIYRKRESGSGKLTLKGYLLAYAEGA